MQLLFEEPYPVSDAKIRAFIMYQKHESRAYPTLRNYMVALVYYFTRENLPDLTKSLQFKGFKCGLRRVMLGDSNRNRKEPLGAADLQKILGKVGTATLRNNEFMLLCSFCFYGFLRINEARSLLWGDVTRLLDGGISLIIRKSKTDKFGVGETVVIQERHGPVQPQRFLLPGLHRPLERLFPYSETTYRNILIWALGVLGYSDHLFSFHSFRRGGAYYASINGVEDAVIKSFGRWKSQQYIVYVHVHTNRAARQVADALFAVVPHTDD
jgi:integrase